MRLLTGLLLFFFCVTRPFFAYSQQPVAQFSADVVAGCTPLIVKFTDLSTNNPLTWSWNLGNGTLSTLKDPVTSYFLPGMYTITLTVTNASGSQSLIKSNYIVVDPVPLVNFASADTAGCLPLSARFTELSGGTANQWEWNFGDGTTSNQQNPVHVYKSPGSYGIFLKVTNQAGCSNVLFKPAYIRVSGATAGFTFNLPSYCAFPVIVPFTNTSVGIGNISYTWDFGDGSPASALANPSHSYTSFGSYTVTLIARAGNNCADTIRKVVNLFNQATQFTGPDSLCIGSTGNFTVTSTPSPVSVKWNMGDGTVYTAGNIKHVFNAAGTFMIKLVNDFGGCSDSITRNVVVTDTPAIQFTAPITRSCTAPLNVSFQATGSNVVRWQWDFGDGSTSALQNPVHNYLNPGLYTVKLAATNGNGCRALRQLDTFVQIRPPSIGIYNLPSGGCVPYTFTPSALINAVDGVASYFWDFGDGSTSSVANPSHTYLIPGTYSLKVRIVTKGGCTDSLLSLNSIRVGMPVNVDFVANPTLVCAGAPVLFTPLVSGSSLTYAWEFGDGSVSYLNSPSHNYSDTGFYNIRLLVVSDGCASSAIKYQFVRATGTVSKFSFSLDCVQRGRVAFKNNSISAISQQWDFGDGNSSTSKDPIHTYSAPGSYLVRLVTIDNSCADTSYQKVPILLSGLQVKVSMDTICRGDSATIKIIHPLPSQILSYHWNFDGSNNYVPSVSDSVVRKFTTSGNVNFKGYTVDSSGCTDTIINNNLIRVNGPAAWFGSNNKDGCAGTTILFTDSTITDGIHPVTGWLWDYGDGVTQNATAPPFRHTYASQGIYSVKLRVTDQSGCYDTITRVNYIHSFEGTAGFSSNDTNTCVGKPVSFTNLSSGSIVNYQWDFGNGTTSSSRNPVYAYPDTGLYTIKLTITTSAGCLSTFTRANYINTKKPVAKFSVSDSTTTCAPLQVSFIDSSYYATGWEWSFGDASSSVVQHPAKVYSIPGTFIARLIVTSPGTCDTAYQTMKISGPYGILSYTPTSGCSPVTVSFRAVTNGAINFTWDFDDGAVIPGKDSAIVHTYTTSGIYNPRVLLQDNSGCTIPLNGSDTIYAEKIVAKFAVDKNRLCDSGTVVFRDQSTSIGNLTYSWEFGDGGRSGAKNPAHHYASPGVYAVKLTVSSFGCVDSVSYPSFISVLKSPVIQIIADSVGCAPQSFAFSYTSLPDTSAITRWQWLFGNGQGSALQNPPAQFFSTGGTFTNILTVTNANGCTASTQKPIRLVQTPSLNLMTDTTICRGDSIRFNLRGPGTHTWLSPAPNLSCTNCADPYAFPVSDQLYKVRVQSAFCTREDSVFVHVQQPFNVIAMPGAVSLCRGNTVQLNASGAPNYVWIPSTGLNNNNIANPIAMPDTATAYNVLGYDTLGCFTDTATVLVAVSKLPSVQLGADLSLLNGGTINLNAVASADVIRFQWMPVRGLSCSVCPAPVASPQTTTTYTLTVQNAAGCSAVDTITVAVLCDERSGIYIPNTFSPNGDGSNDVFYVRGKGAIVQSMQIFNRWGELIFDRKNVSLNNAADGWDGTYKGKKEGSGVFIYVVNVSCSGGRPLKYTGNITLIQ